MLARQSNIVGLALRVPVVVRVVIAKRLPGLAAVTLVLVGLAAASWAQENGQPNALPADPVLAKGQAIYARSCAECHGGQGEGVAGSYADPLIGDASIGELTRLIADDMPLDEPETCVGEDAAAVAAYIHHAFYSEAARIRNRPPRIALARLTGTQLRQSLADLYGHFAGSMWRTEERGLRGTYFDGARWRNENKKIERVDPTLDFDFQRNGPGEGINAEDFFIQWRGALKVDVTGPYELIVRSTCAFVFNFGTFERVLINNRIQSGDQTEFREAVYLTAGRVYPLQIELYQRKRSTGQPPARISLAWVPPGGTEQTIPRHHLLPGSAPAVYSLQVHLPADDRSYGFERGLAVDRQWDDSTTAAALEFADVAAGELWARYRRDRGRDGGRSGRARGDSGARGDTGGRGDMAGGDENRDRLRSFLTEVVETAFRGPLDEASRKFYVNDQVDATEDDSEAIKRCLLAALKSPRFLYPTLDADRSPSQRVANRLALTLFDSLPADEWLITAVRENKLTSEGEIRSAAERMVGDYRGQAKTREFLYEWLNLRHLGEVTKNRQRFPEFDEPLIADLKASLDAFLDEVVWSESSDYRQLFLADWNYTTPRMSEYYGQGWQPREGETGGLTRTATGGDGQFGLLSHPYLMSGLAYQDSTSPIHRGVFLIRYLLGRTIRPPADAFAPLSPDLHPDLTTRERVELQTSPESCQVCHTKINGLGFTLENFDAVGRFRSQEGEKPIDPTGSYTDRNGQVVGFQGPRDLANYLAGSDDAYQAFVNRAFQHFVKQPVAAYGPDRLAQLTARFKESQFQIRNLLVEIAVIAARQPLENASQEP
ncbi:MAG: DUF1588 domain-containing protein [Pirellulaceae bacterium]|nr:DUF1588 domain-containing protein [Pirellulaceae bacterium]